MVLEISWMKQAEKPAHSSGRSGGDNRVFECPGRGVLQMIATATEDITSSPRRKADYAQRLQEVPIEIIRILQSGGKAQQIIRAGRVLAFDRAAVLDQALGTAERSRPPPQPHSGRHSDRLKP